MVDLGTLFRTQWDPEWRPKSNFSAKKGPAMFPGSSKIALLEPTAGPEAAWSAPGFIFNDFA